jgi:hypothetical protein
MMHFISEIPDPAAYGANDFTSAAATKANIVYEMLVFIEKQDHIRRRTAKTMYMK